MTDQHLAEERMMWLARHALPHEAALRSWLGSRRLPGLEIDDIIQDTYVRLIRARDVDTIHNHRAYIFRTAMSVMTSHVRHERIIAIQTMADINDLGTAVDEPSPEQQVADRDELVRVGEAIAGLPGKIGDVFRLRRMHGLSQKEVAAQLGLAESTVEKHVKRGLLLLLQRFTRGGSATRHASMPVSKELKQDDG